MSIWSPNAAEKALPPLTPDELAWAKSQFVSHPYLRQKALEAQTLDEAVRIVKSQCGGCGPCRDPESENIRDLGYWYDAHGEPIEFFVGVSSGDVGSETRTRGERYTRLTWRGIVRELREKAGQEVLF